MQRGTKNTLFIQCNTISSGAVIKAPPSRRMRRDCAPFYVRSNILKPQFWIWWCILFLCAGRKVKRLVDIPCVFFLSNFFFFRYPLDCRAFRTAPPFPRVANLGKAYWGNFELVAKTYICNCKTCSVNFDCCIIVLKTLGQVSNPTPNGKFQFQTWNY